MQVKAGQSIQTQTKEVEKLKMLLRGLEVGTMCAKSVFTFYVRVCNKGGGRKPCVHVTGRGETNRGLL